MTQTEKDALWIKSERKKMARLIGSISELVSEQFLINADDSAKYEITFETHGLGFLELRVYESGCDGPIDKIDFWGLRRIFDSSSPFFRKQYLQEEIDNATFKIKEIKALAKKYAKLNAIS